MRVQEGIFMWVGVLVRIRLWLIVWELRMWIRWIWICILSDLLIHIGLVHLILILIFRGMSGMILLIIFLSAMGLNMFACWRPM